jgi:hypothetical protein
MISVSDGFNTALQAVNRIWSLRVKVTRNSAIAIPLDITDRVIDCSINWDWERRSASASLTLDNFDYSLSPLNQSSTTNQVSGLFDPLLDSNHMIEIWEGLLTEDGYEYVKRFTGVLGDEIDADTYPGIIQLTARDKSKLLQDTFIYQSKTYGLSGGAMPLPENVIQDMITTFLPSGGVTLAVDDPTNFVVGRPDQPYTAKDINLWDAIQQLSDAFNFSVMFDENGSLRLKKVVRDLSTVTPVYSFDETKITKDRVSTSDSDVRNHVMLRVQGLDPIEKKNEDSIAKYGRRYFEIHRSLSYLITSAEQGHELVDNILKDMSYVVPVDKIEMPLFPLIQVGDVVSLTNTKLGQDSTTYRYRVVEIGETFSKDKKRTQLTLNGYNTFAPSDSIAPNPITDLQGSTISRSIQNYPNSGWTGYTKTEYFPRLNWTPPTNDVSGNALSADFGGYSIYRKAATDSTFYPIASVKSYIAPLDLVVDYWHDYYAPLGNNQYKIIAFNKYGKVSSESSVLTLAKLSDAIT